MTKKQTIKKLSNTLEILNGEISSIENLLVESRKHLEDYDADIQLMLSMVEVRNYIKDLFNDWIE